MYLTHFVMLDTQQNLLVQVTHLSKKTTNNVLIFTLLLLFMSGDTDLNPGPNKTNSSSKVSVHQWNLNRLAARNIEKVGLRRAIQLINLI